jgi:hypothetical protein
LLFAQCQHTWWDNANFNTPTSSPFFKYAFCREDDTIKLAMNFYFGSSRIRSRRCLRSSCALALPNVCSWHKADILNALTNVRFGGKADSDQPLITNLDL